MVSAPIVWSERSIKPKLEPWPDLALISVLPAPIQPIPIFLDSPMPGATIRLVGFPSAGGASTMSSDLGAFDSLDGDQGELLKLVGALVRPGYSGGMVVDCERAGVCGVILASRDVSQDLGGYGVALGHLFDRAPELRDDLGSSASVLNTWRQLLGRARNQESDSTSSSLGKPRELVSTFSPPTALGTRYVERPMLDNEVVRRLTHVAPELTARTITYVVGSAGFGKSSLAAHISSDPRVLERFSDGVYWIDVGRNGDLIGTMRGLLATLEPESTPPAGIEEASTRLAISLTGKACLLVLDDVWDRKAIEYLGRADVTGRVLVTTRKRGLGQALDEVLVGEFRPDESTSLLRSRLSIYVAESQLQRVASTLGHWPLLLDLAARATQANAAIQSTSEPAALQAVLDRVARLGPAALDSRGSLSREDAIAVTIEYSLGAQPELDRTRCEALGVFHPQDYVPLEVVWKFWNALDGQPDPEGTAHELAETSLIQLVDGGRAIRLHEQLWNWFRQQATPHMERLASALLASWGDPDTVLRRADAYQVRWYSFQLHQGREYERLSSLVSPKWVKSVRDLLHSDWSLIRDTDLAIDGAGKLRDHVVMLRHASMSAAMHQRVRSLPVEAIGLMALMGLTEEAVAAAELHADPVQRTAALISVAAESPSEAAIIRAYRAAADVASLTRRTQLTRDLIRIAAPHYHDFASTMARAASREATEAPSSWSQDVTMLAAASGLAIVGAPRDAFELTNRIADPWIRSEAMKDVVSALCEADQLDTARSTARAIYDAEQRGLALALTCGAFARHQRYAEARELISEAPTLTTRILCCEAVLTSGAKLLPDSVVDEMVADAFAHADWLHGQADTCSAKARLLISLIAGGFGSRASSLATALVEEATSVSYVADRVVACASVSKALAKIGMSALANNAYDVSVGSVVELPRAKTEASFATRHESDPGDPTRLTGRLALGPGQQRDPVLVEVCLAGAAVRRYEDALRWSSEISGASARQAARAAVGRSAMTHGQPRVTDAILVQIQSDEVVTAAEWYKRRAIGALAETLGRVRDVSGLERLVQEPGARALGGRPLGRAAVGLAIHDLELACQWAGRAIEACGDASDVDSVEGLELANSVMAEANPTNYDELAKCMSRSRAVDVATRIADRLLEDSVDVALSFLTEHLASVDSTTVAANLMQSLADDDESTRLHICRFGVHRSDRIADAHPRASARLKLVSAIKSSTVICAELRIALNDWIRRISAPGEAEAYADMALILGDDTALSVVAQHAIYLSETTAAAKASDSLRSAEALAYISALRGDLSSLERQATAHVFAAMQVVDGTIRAIEFLHRLHPRRDTVVSPLCDLILRKWRVDLGTFSSDAARTLVRAGCGREILSILNLSDDMTSTARAEVLVEILREGPDSERNSAERNLIQLASDAESPELADDVHGSMFHVLVELGRIDEALDALRRVTDGARASRAIIAARRVIGALDGDPLYRFVRFAAGTDSACFWSLVEVLGSYDSVGMAVSEVLEGVIEALGTER